jgi:hypothetical protein
MKVIAIAHRSETHSPEDFAPHLDAEADHALGLFGEEKFRELYSRTDGKGAIIVLEADSVEQAEAYLNSLPFAQRGMLSFDVYGTAPYRGFMRGIS